MRGRSFPWIATGVIVADQATKGWVHHSLPVGSYRVALPGVLKLTHVHNTGSAFSLFQGAGGWLVLVSIIALMAILRYWLGLRRRGEAISPALLLVLHFMRQDAPAGATNEPPEAERKLPGTAQEEGLAVPGEG